MRKRRSPSASASAVFRSIRSFVEEHDTLSAIVAGSIVFRLFYENSEFGFVSNLTSVSRIQEGLRFSSVADAVYVSNQPPLVLLFYDWVLSCLPLSLFNILCDAAGSLALFELCRLNLQHERCVPTTKSTKSTRNCTIQPTLTRPLRSSPPLSPL